jgi:hypothetical protein
MVWFVLLVVMNVCAHILLVCLLSLFSIFIAQLALLFNFILLLIKIIMTNGSDMGGTAVVPATNSTHAHALRSKTSATAAAVERNHHHDTMAEGLALLHHHHGENEGFVDEEITSEEDDEDDMIMLKNAMDDCDDKGNASPAALAVTLMEHVLAETEHTNMNNNNNNNHQNDSTTHHHTYSLRKRKHGDTDGSGEEGNSSHVAIKHHSSVAITAGHPATATTTTHHRKKLVHNTRSADTSNHAESSSLAVKPIRQPQHLQTTAHKREPRPPSTMASPRRCSKSKPRSTSKTALSRAQPLAAAPPLPMIEPAQPKPPLTMEQRMNPLLSSTTVLGSSSTAPTGVPNPLASIPYVSVTATELKDYTFRPAPIAMAATVPSSSFVSRKTDQDTGIVKVGVPSQVPCPLPATAFQDDPEVITNSVIQNDKSNDTNNNIILSNDNVTSNPQTNNSYQDAIDVEPMQVTSFVNDKRKVNFNDLPIEPSTTSSRMRGFSIDIDCKYILRFGDIAHICNMQLNNAL